MFLGCKEKIKFKQQYCLTSQSEITHFRFGDIHFIKAVKQQQLILLYTYFSLNQLIFPTVEMVFAC